jgi:streptomycin 6-kinase
VTTGGDRPSDQPGLAWIARTAEGRDWLDRLPTLLGDAASRWSLELGEPFPNAFESLVVPAERPDGSKVVLKLPFRGRESEHEAAALRSWAGDGAVELLDADADGYALLLERAVPGTPLADAGPEVALDVFVDLLPRLWRPAQAPFRTLADEAAWWVGGLEPEWERAGRPFERDLLETTTAALRELPTTQGPLVLVHQDLHAGNVLRASRRPWLAIDPKPLLAEREFSLAPIVRDTELGHSRDAVVGRLDRLCSGLGLDRERARRWTIAQTIAWSLTDEGAITSHLEVARWLADAQE